MLDVAKKYEEEIHKKYYDTWYDPHYQYYRDSSGDRLPQFADNCYERRDFVCLDEKDHHVIGYISYSFNEVSRSAFNFGIISFEKCNLTFAKDLLQVISDIFFKFHLDRMEFWCIADNPAVKGYRSFIKRFGGREVGYLRRSTRLMDGKFHDTLIFEILREDLKWRWTDRNLVPELAYRTGYTEQEKYFPITPRELDDKEFVK